MLDPVRDKELRADIAALEVGPLNPQTYEKMAALKTVQFFQDLEQMGGLTRFLDMADRANHAQTRQAESRRSAPETVETASTSDFLLAVNGKPIDAVLRVLDDHMNTLRQVRERAYDAVMRRIREIPEGPGR